MIHVILEYIKVAKNIEFIKISTILLEFRTRIKIEYDIQRNNDGSYLITEIDSFRRNILKLCNWRQYKYHQTLILDDLKVSNVYIDKVTQFGLRPPEFLKIFDTLGNYYLWFNISKAKLVHCNYLK